MLDSQAAGQPAIDLVLTSFLYLSYFVFHCRFLFDIFREHPPGHELLTYLCQDLFVSKKIRFCAESETNGNEPGPSRLTSCGTAWASPHESGVEPGSNTNVWRVETECKFEPDTALFFSFYVWWGFWRGESYGLARIQRYLRVSIMVHVLSDWPSFAQYSPYQLRCSDWEADSSSYLVHLALEAMRGCFHCSSSEPDTRVCF